MSNAARPNSPATRPTPPRNTVSGRTVAPRRPTHGPPPSSARRPYDPRTRPATRPLYRTTDHRYARPSYRYVRPYGGTTYVVPARSYYRPYYTRWYVHPYYRHVYATNVAVGFGFSTYAWRDTWAPPPRPGWVWNPGYWNAWGYWCPGYWTPRPRVSAPVGYVYVPGWWSNDVYVDGYYRRASRAGWAWDDGYYLENGDYVRGHWTPTQPPRDGYTWEAGFWDGETWVEGFWRPEYRRGFTWVSAFYDDEGVFNAGYWMPTVDRPGSVWVPGWFDGNTWIEGYWEDAGKYSAADPQDWKPEEGWDDGWEAGSGWGDGEVVDNKAGAPDDEGPIALPVAFSEADLEDVTEDEQLPPM
ncbi:MAG: hypothetical protein H6736_06585 [Alphaproteobacteria bacterium]|nr:hypothetical protein [Alphaproteobacteria bacterium]